MVTRSDRMASFMSTARMTDPPFMMRYYTSGLQREVNDGMYQIRGGVHNVGHQIEVGVHK